MFSGDPEARGSLRRRFVVPAAAALVSLIVLWVANRGVTPRPTPAVPASGASRLEVASESSRPREMQIAGMFRPNQTITDVLTGHGVSRDLAFQLVDAARPVYNLARIVASRPYWISLTPEGDFRSFRYKVDEENLLRVDRDGALLIPSKEKIPFETRVEVVSGTISDSLFVAVTSAGEHERLALDLADIFMWDVDFNTEIQPGDSFRLLVEKKYLNGKFERYGSILAANLINQSRALSAYRFKDENGKPDYFGPDGRSLRKSFLRSPIPFARVTSRFSPARRHPILRIVRPHFGVDYAAPAGTPIVAVGAGSVVSAGWNGGGGRAVRLRHANGYETLYMHLSRIAVRTGDRITQGQVIGNVGTTGLSTGPHLDFRVSRHGNFVNPTKVVFPPAPPVPQEALADFTRERDKLRTDLGETAPFSLH